MKFLIRSTPVLVLCIFIWSTFRIDISPDVVLTPAAEASTRQAASTILSADLQQIRSLLPLSTTDDEAEAFMLVAGEAIEEYLLEPVTGKLQLVSAENRRSKFTPEGMPIYLASYEVQRTNDIVLVEVAVADGTAQTSALTWFFVRQLDAAITGANDFGSIPLTAPRIIFIIVLVTNIVFVVVTATVVIADSAQPHRWLWTLFTLFGMWGLTLNWTTGAVQPNFITWNDEGVRLSPIIFQLLGGNVVRSNYISAWMFEIGLPVGALAYWWKRKTRGRRSAEIDVHKPSDLP